MNTPFGPAINLGTLDNPNYAGAAGGQVVKQLVGDARALPLRDETVDLVVTSPPYFGLRDYGSTTVEIGAELKVADYVNTLLDVVHECMRVLRPDGSLFIVIGDKYVSDNRGSGVDRKRGANKHAPAGPGGFVGREVAPKGSLMGLPYRLAFAVLEAGYYWRQDIVWHKPNPLPDPAIDRCSRAHESVLHFTKSRHYYTAAVTRGGHGPDVWNEPVRGYKDPYGRKHPAVYPEKLVARCIVGWCPEQGLVLDPFAGSGTTAAVAVRLGRNAIGVEANPEYAAIARTRAGAA